MRAVGQPYTRLGSTYGSCARTAADPEVRMTVDLRSTGRVTESAGALTPDAEDVRDLQVPCNATNLHADDPWSPGDRAGSNPRRRRPRNPPVRHVTRESSMKRILASLAAATVLTARAVLGRDGVDAALGLRPRSAASRQRAASY